MFNVQGDELNEVPFDPKTGFTIRNLSLEDSKSYKCLIEEDGKKHAVSYALFVRKCGLDDNSVTYTYKHTRFFIYDFEMTLNGLM